MEIDEFLQVSQVRPHDMSVAGPSMQPLDLPGTDVGRPPVPTPRGASQRKHASDTGAQNETSLLLEQMRSMQEENRREFHRIELQVQADRRAMEDTIRQLSAQVVNGVTATTASSPQANQSWPRQDMASDSVGCTNRATILQTPGNQPLGNVRGSTRLPRPATSVSFATHAQPLDLTAHRSRSMDREDILSSQQQPSTSGAHARRGLSPEQLNADSHPIKRLRRDRASADKAKELLEEIGYVAVKGKSVSTETVDAPWPEDYIDRLDGTEPTYESLSLCEFVAGYLSIMEENLPSGVGSENIRRHLNYLRGLMEDCFETEWTVVRTAHKQVLHGIEHGRLKWGDASACMSVKANAIQSVLRIQQLEPVVRAADTDRPLNPCPLYQSLNCQLPVEHTVGNVLYTHCCSYCHRTTGVKNSHAETNCRKKQEADTKRSKNSKRRRRQQRD